MIDFELLKYADIEVVNGNPTPEEVREVSEFLKAYREKGASSKKPRPIPSRAVAAARKKAKAK
jgi:hypothetical protein